MQLAISRDSYLGPAELIEVDGDRLRIEMPDGTACWSLSALSFPYQPAAGDTVLSIRQGEDCYVIGVLRGSGKTSFTAPADLEFRAPFGRIDLQSPHVRILSGKLEVVAQSIYEKFATATRWVTQTLSLRAGRLREKIDGDAYTRAQKITHKATDDVKLTARKIRLG